MTNQQLAGSASLPLRMGAFGALYSMLVVSFTPVAAFVLALAASIILARV
ncbi:hypothetical protein [uncultured Amphritea sp.]|nr:hypothetical protein [uncultured Amphritea sp.]